MLILLTAVLGPMVVITVELLTTSGMNLGAEEFLTPVTASYCTRVKESASAFILVVAMTIYIMISCFYLENINLVEGVSCIAYICKCVLLNGKRDDDVDFD